MKKILTTSAILVMALSSCKQPPVISNAGYIIGTNDLVPLEGKIITDVKAELRLATVLIATRLNNGKVKFCTGFLINGSGRTRVMSNHHCFAKQNAKKLATEELLEEACVNTTVYLGHTPVTSDEVTIHTCKKDSLRTDFVGDAAVFDIEGEIPEKYLPLDFFAGDANTVAGEALIVHYPDIPQYHTVPKGSAIKVPAASVTIKDCDITGPFPKNEWHLDRTLPFSTRHTCDIIHGSSGSALIHKDTGTIFGLNWGGIEIAYGERKVVQNVATKVDYLQAFLANEAGKFRNENRSSGSSSNVLVAKENSGEKVEVSNKDKLKNAVSKTCGTLGATTSVGASLFMILFLLFPLLMVGNRRR